MLAFGLFGFAGGVTNWLAITMLFDEVPGLYGSGIIPKQFKQIKATMKTMIMCVSRIKTDLVLYFSVVYHHSTPIDTVLRFETPLNPSISLQLSEVHNTDRPSAPPIHVSTLHTLIVVTSLTHQNC